MYFNTELQVPWLVAKCNKAQYNKDSSYLNLMR